MRVAVAMDIADRIESTRQFQRELLPYTPLWTLFLVLAGLAQMISGLRSPNDGSQR